MEDRVKYEVLVSELKGDLDLKKMIAHNQHKYLLVNLLARRTRELNEGSRPLVSTEALKTPLEVAAAEARAGALKIVLSEKEEVVVDLVNAE